MTAQGTVVASIPLQPPLQEQMQNQGATAKKQSNKSGQVVSLTKDGDGLIQGT